LVGLRDSKRAESKQSGEDHGYLAHHILQSGVFIWRLTKSKEAVVT
jgi:hypothetical protein